MVEGKGDGRKMLVLLNFSSSGATAAVKVDMTKANPLLSNYTGMPLINKATSTVTLKPYQAVVYKL